ncbi:MAG TPA: peptidase M23 [Crenotrichaceae bacterium]|nr:peptidase M23 [Crenotrichaceae bacterium]
MHYIISKLIVVVLITQVLLVSGCSGFGTFNSILEPEQTNRVTTTGQLDKGESHSARPQIDHIETSSLTNTQQASPEPNPELLVAPVSKVENWITHTIKKGQSLVGILNQYGVSTSESNALVKSSKIARRLQTIQAGRQLRLLLADNKDLLELEYKSNQTETIKISKTDSGFVSNLVSADVTREQSYVYGKIHNSLFTDAKAAGLPDTLIMRLADIFAWDIDFALHIHNGDTFSVLYEQLSIDGKPIGTGDILAAEFINHGKVYRAVRYKDNNNHVNYYSPDGKGLRQAFLRTPVKFSRISSRFSLGRRHPVLNRIRAHKGVDYAAAKGTPVRATGAGKIIHRGRKGGYGKVVILKHGSKYSSLYAHLSNYRKGQHVGSSVKQGDIIGYVGSTGLATGPHLHYEFRVAGVHKNPLTVKLPKSISIPKQELLAFQSQTTPLLQELNKQTNIMLASSSTVK